MSAEKYPPNPSAFPLFVPASLMGEADSGMTLRDYFAAKAMQSMTGTNWPNASDFEEISKRAYWAADAMLEERAKP